MNDAQHRRLFARHRGCAASAMAYEGRVVRCEECGLRWVLKRHHATGAPIAYVLMEPQAARTVAFA